MIAGNGGSASDADHIVAELMKSFLKERPLTEIQKLNILAVDDARGNEMIDKLQNGLPAISLCDNSPLMTAIMNDCDASLIYAQKIMGIGMPEDVFIGISTSGNSPNIINAAIVAKSKNIKVIGLTGENESLLQKYSDICIKVPESETYKVQELHLPVYHCLCMMVEEHFYGKNETSLAASQVV